MLWYTIFCSKQIIFFCFCWPIIGRRPAANIPTGFWSSIPTELVMLLLRFVTKYLNLPSKFTSHDNWKWRSKSEEKENIVGFFMINLCLSNSRSFSKILFKRSLKMTLEGWIKGKNKSNDYGFWWWDQSGEPNKKKDDKKLIGGSYNTTKIPLHQISYVFLALFFPNLTAKFDQMIKVKLA